MKVVYASTEEQEEILAELTSYFYTSVFPRYFNDEEIAQFLEMKILQLPAHKEEQLYTLTVAFQAIASLQVIISILETPHRHKKQYHYSSLFQKNMKILHHTGLFFPFTYENFFNCKNAKTDTILSIYSKPANEILI